MRSIRRIFASKNCGDAQLSRFRNTGLADSVLGQATFSSETWIARFGHVLDREPALRYGILCGTLVNALCEEIPASVAVSSQKRAGRGERGSATNRPVERRGHFRPPCRARQRAQCRCPSHAGNHPSDRKPGPFDLDRLRHCPTRRSSLPLPAMTDFQERAVACPLHHAVSDSGPDRRTCSPIGTSMIPGCARSAAPRWKPCMRCCRASGGSPATMQ